MAIVTSDSRSKPQRAAETLAGYDPTSFRAQTFFDATPRFRTGEDDPRRYLERCLELIAAREPLLKAWVVIIERISRSDRRGNDSGRDWNAGGRFRDQAGELLRQLGTQADAGRDPPRRAAELQPEHDRRTRRIAHRYVARRNGDCTTDRRRSRPSGPVRPDGSARSGQTAAAHRDGDFRLE